MIKLVDRPKNTFVFARKKVLYFFKWDRNAPACLTQVKNKRPVMMRIRHVASTLLSFIILAGLSACNEDDAPSVDSPSPETTQSMTLFEEGRELVANTCTACHMELEDGGLSRISESRRTPEGWEMNVVRMMRFHGLDLSRSERRAIVKYLSDTNGLAPSETTPFRYALERQPDVIEAQDNPRMMEMCARCHSMARIGLQRRTKTEWDLLVQMHAGQWPTLEYQMLSRDRDWLDEASGWVVDDLSKAYAFDDPAWASWQAADQHGLDGKWRYVSYIRGQGYHHGMLEFDEKQGDEYSVRYDSVTPDGTSVSGDYSGILYTGYEWRGRGQFGDAEAREVAALSEDGNSLTGRWFEADQDEKGGSIHAVRLGSGSRIMAVVGEALPRGGEQELVVYGAELKGGLDLGPGVTAEVLEADSNHIRARVAIAGDAEPGRRSIRVGEETMTDAVAVYDRIDRVEVAPDYGVGRVGGHGGTRPKQTVQFEAIAFSNGADGEAGTADDFRIGVMNADWSLAPTDETSEMMEDVKFAGTMSQNGLFTPGAAGPNPERRFGTNNAGDLQVTASVRDGDRSVEGQARLIVTVQRWNEPPIY